MFERKGAIAVDHEACPIDEDELMELALEAGAEDFASEDTYYEIITMPEDYVAVREALENNNIPLISGEITMLPSTYTEVPEAKKASMDKLMAALDNDDDIQNVYTNMQ